jgi:hypothetical protein
MKNFIVYEDYVESLAEAVLLPGYQILDMGYSANSTYQVVLIGKVSVRGSVASQQPSQAVQKSSGQKVVEPVARFIKYVNGVVYDKHTGLEWFSETGPNSSPPAWCSLR